MPIRRWLLLAALSGIAACGTDASPRPGTADAGGNAGTGIRLPDGGGPEVPAPERLDLLLMVDNTWAMDSKSTPGRSLRPTN